MKQTIRTKNNLTWYYAMLQAFYWMTVAAAGSYAPFFLLDAKLTNTEIGLLLAVASALSVIIQPVVGSYADRPGSLSIRVMTMIMSGVMLAGSFMLLVLFRRNTPGTAAFYFLIQLFILLQQPFLNSIGAASINSGSRLDFGISRAAGSLGYTVSAFLVGRFSESAGPVIIPVAAAVCAAGMIFFTRIYPLEKQRKGGNVPGGASETGAVVNQAEGRASGKAAVRPESSGYIDAGSAAEKAVSEAGAAAKERSSSSLLSFFSRYPQYTVALISLVLIFLSHIYINTYLLQIVEDKGGGSGTMGNLMSLAALLELTVMLTYGWLRKLRPDHFWFRISGIFFMLKILLTLLVPTAGLMYPVQILQPLGWGLQSVSMVYYINEMMDDSDIVKGQAFYTAAYTIAQVLGNLSAGILIDRGGVSAMLLTGTIAAAIGTVVLLLSAKVRVRRCHPFTF